MRRLRPSGIAAKDNPFAAPVRFNRSNALCARHNILQCAIESIRIRCRNSDQKASCRLRVIQQILFRKLRFPRVHAHFRKGAVAIHARRQKPHPRKLQRFRNQIDRRYVKCKRNVAARCHLIGMAQKAESRYIRAGMHRVLHHHVPRSFIERRHQSVHQSLAFG